MEIKCAATVLNFHSLIPVHVSQFQLKCSNVGQDFTRDPGIDVISHKVHFVKCLQPCYNLARDPCLIALVRKGLKCVWDFDRHY